MLLFGVLEYKSEYIYIIAQITVQDLTAQNTNMVKYTAFTSNTFQAKAPSKTVSNS